MYDRPFGVRFEQCGGDVVRSGGRPVVWRLVKELELDLVLGDAVLTFSRENKKWRERTRDGEEEQQKQQKQ